MQEKKGEKSVKRKKIVCLVCLILVVTSCMLPGIKTYAAQIEPAKKIISVVYDDSGSMWDENDSWAAANYAMQAFAGLLSTKDEMYITYMSDVGSSDEGAKNVNLNNPQDAVNSIKADSEKGGGTPLHSVEIALDKLKNVKSIDETDQYWLVILTDGAMSASGAKASDLQSLLDSCKGMTMSNGSSLQTYYMGIGNAVSVNGDSGKGLYSIMAGFDIVPALSDVANKVSGRMKFASSEINQIDGKTVKLYSEIPLYNISVFSQNSKAQVTAAKGESPFHVDRNVSLESPNAVLYGNAALITNGTNVIQPGEYTFNFSEDISLEDTVFMYQIAIEMKPVLTKNGVTLDDVSEVAPGDVIDIELVPTNPETGNPIEDSKLPQGITWGIGYHVDGNTIKDSQTRSLTGVTVEKGENKITCTMQIPDYAPMVQTITFSPVDPVVYSISVTSSDDDIYNRNELGLDNCLGIPDRFYLTADGVPLGKAEVEKLDFSKMGLEVIDVQIDDSMLNGFFDKFGSVEAPVKLKLQDDGSYVVYPGKGLIPAFMLQAGAYTVTVAIKSDNNCGATGTFYVNPRMVDWIDFWWILVLLLLILYVIYILFIKAKFEGQTVNIDVFKPFGSDGEGTLQKSQCDQIVLHKYTLNTFLPTKASACQLPGIGIKVYADGYGGIYFQPSALKGYQKAGPSGSNPINNYVGVINSLKDTDKLMSDAKSSGTRMITLGGSPYYFKQGNRLYRVTVN